MAVRAYSHFVVRQTEKSVIWTIKACRLCSTPTYPHSTVKYCFKYMFYVYSTNTHRYTSLRNQQIILDVLFLPRLLYVALHWLEAVEWEWWE